MTENDIISLYKTFYKRKKFTWLDPTPLIPNHPDVFWTFTPSFGATLYIDLVKRPDFPLIHGLNYYTIQPCIRLQDLGKTSAFFRMACTDQIFGTVPTGTEQLKLTALKNWWAFAKSVGLEKFKTKLYATVCDEGKLDNIDFEFDNIAYNFWLNEVQLPKENIKVLPPEKQETVFFSRAEPLGGQMTEIHYDLNGKSIELGMFAHFEYSRLYKEDDSYAIAKTLKELESPEFAQAIYYKQNNMNIFSSAFGVERLCMALANFDVQDLHHNALLASTINNNFYMLDLARLAVLLCSEGLSIKGKNHGRSQLLRKKILTPLKTEVAKSGMSRAELTDFLTTILDYYKLTDAKVPSLVYDIQEFCDLPYISEK